MSMKNITQIYQLSNKLKYKSNDEFIEEFNKEFLKINI